MQKVFVVLLGLIALVVPLTAVAAGGSPDTFGVCVESAPLTGNAVEVDTKVAEVFTANGYLRLARDAWRKKADATCSMIAHVKTLPLVMAQSLTCHLAMTASGCDEQAITNEVRAIMHAVASP